MKLARFLARSGNPSQARSGQPSWSCSRFPRNETVHNGGMLAFGPDGMLYAADGRRRRRAGPGEADGEAVAPSTCAARRTRSRPTIPFTGQAGRLWGDLGLRPAQPWRFSFDKLDGRPLDPETSAKSSWEEVDYLPAGTPAGVNFGWPYCEGTHDGIIGTCASIASRLPLLEYPHDLSGGLTVIGGYVYRGSSLPSLYGSYLYADWSFAKLWMRPTPAGPSVEVANPSMIASFGEANDGELYLVAITGELYQLGDAAGGGVHPFPDPVVADGAVRERLDADSRTRARRVQGELAALVRRGAEAPLDRAAGHAADRLLRRRQLELSVGTAFVKHFRAAA